MIATAYAAPRVVHAIPGRIRIHVPAWVGGAASRLDRVRREVGRLGGVHRVSLSALTGNLLLHFDPGATAPVRLLDAIGRLLAGPTAPPAPPPAASGRIAPCDIPRERRVARGRGLLPLLTTLPRARRVLQTLLGRRIGTLVAFLPGIVGVIRALAAGGGPIGLAVAGLEAAQLFGEIGGALRAA